MTCASAGLDGPNPVFRKSRNAPMTSLATREGIMATVVRSLSCSRAAARQPAGESESPATDRASADLHRPLRSTSARAADAAAIT